MIRWVGDLRPFVFASCTCWSKVTGVQFSGISTRWYRRSSRRMNSGLPSIAVRMSCARRSLRNGSTRSRTRSLMTCQKRAGRVVAQQHVEPLDDLVAERLQRGRDAPPCRNAGLEGVEQPQHVRVIRTGARLRKLPDAARMQILQRIRRGDRRARDNRPTASPRRAPARSRRRQTAISVPGTPYSPRNADFPLSKLSGKQSITLRTKMQIQVAKTGMR